MLQQQLSQMAEHYTDMVIALLLPRTRTRIHACTLPLAASTHSLQLDIYFRHLARRLCFRYFRPSPRLGCRASMKASKRKRPLRSDRTSGAAPPVAQCRSLPVPLPAGTPLVHSPWAPIPPFLFLWPLSFDTKCHFSQWPFRTGPSMPRVSALRLQPIPPPASRDRAACGRGRAGGLDGFASGPREFAAVVGDR